MTLTTTNDDTKSTANSSYWLSDLCSAVTHMFTSGKHIETVCSTTETVLFI